MVRGSKASHVSVAAFNKSCMDFNKKFSRIESLLGKLDKGVKNKVSVSAWNKSLEDLNAKVNELFTVSLEKTVSELNDKLDKSVELINELMIHLNEKVSVSAWERSCVELEGLSSDLRSLRSVLDDVKLKVMKLETDFNDSIVNESEIKGWLKSL